MIRAFNHAHALWVKIKIDVLRIVLEVFSAQLLPKFELGSYFDSWVISLNSKKIHLNSVSD